jgi:hypothetical protein
MRSKVISPKQSKTKVNKVVVVVIRISQECRHRHRPRRRRCCCRRRRRRRCRRRRRRHCHRRSFLCSIWRLSIRLKPDKKEKKAVGT